MDKKLLIIGLLIVAISMSGCTSSSVPGTYVHEDEPDEYLVLDVGQTYFVHQADSFGGNYRIVDRVLYLLVPYGSLKLQKSGDDWIDADGDRWVKK